jgi:small-conductance mechanosensitive channel
LILLTERPVKVGDWVSLAGVEGDIRRINVRATEIQMADRSTVIVPNSQFITQNVRNVTMGNALGVVGVTLTLPLDTDVLKIRELLMQAFSEHEAILDTPPPSVSFKDLTNAGLIISVSGYVNSPRSVGGARSDLLFTILGRLRDLGIALSTPPSMVLVKEAMEKDRAEE